MELLVSGLCIGLIAGSVMADTLYVNPTDCDRADHYCEIQTAVNAAQDGDTVMLAAAEYNLWQESIVIRQNVRLTGSGPSSTILFGDGKAPGALVTITESAEDVELSQLSIVGRVMSGSPTMGPGGLDHKGNDLLLDHVHFSKNRGGWGGALRIATLFGNVQIVSCVFTENSGFAGGGLAAYDGSAAEILVSQSSFSNNNANFSGGGVLARDIESVVLDRVTFEGNTAGSTGGGAHFFTDTGESDVRVTGSRFISNEAGLVGGVSAAGERLSVLIETTTFEGNRSRQTSDRADCSGSSIRINSGEYINPDAIVGCTDSTE